VSVTLRRVIQGLDDERAIAVMGGALAFEPQPDGGLRLTTLDIVLADVVAPTDDGHGLHLTDVRLSLAEQPSMLITFTEPGHRASAKVPVTLALDWKIVGESGQKWPLATQKLTGLVLYLQLKTDEHGQWQADVFGHDEGTFWEWSGIYAMKDAVLLLRAQESQGEIHCPRRRCALAEPSQECARDPC
jgi:hypothetical protein